MAVPDVQPDILDRFYAYAPDKPYCTNEPAYGVRVRNKVTAFRRTHIQHNPPSMVHWLTFDQDHDDYFAWEDQHLPDPNIVVRNLDNRRCHLSYAIESVCTSCSARPRPMYYLDAIQRAYGALLRSDRRYSGLLTKNPFSNQFHCHVLHDHVYSLGELADYVDLESGWFTRYRNDAANTDVYGFSRHCHLFDRLRYWAYDHVHDYRKSSTYPQWMTDVLKKSEDYNEFPEPLPYSSLKSTSKSVANWTWKRYHPARKPINRGAMFESFNRLSVNLDVKSKQQMSAQRTHQLRRTAMEEKIIDAIGQLTACNRSVSMRSVAQLVGVSHANISKNYRHLFPEK